MRPLEKGKRYSRLSYNLGKASVKTGQATGRFTKKRLTNTKSDTIILRMEKDGN